MVSCIYSIEEAISLVKDSDLKEELEYQLTNLKEKHEKEIRSYQIEIRNLNLEMEELWSKIEDLEDKVEELEGD